MALFTGHTITPDSALGGTQIQRSLRFNSGSSQYITRTCSSEGNRVKWTWSGWVKKTRLGRTSYALLTSQNDGDGGGNNGIGSIYFHSSDAIHVYYDTTGANNSGAINDTVYRDTNSWYHIVWQVDAANSTSKIWVNGVEQTVNVQPVSGYNYTMNQSGKRMTIGVDAWDLYTYSDTYIAETHFSDGQLYAASDFGYTDAQTGQWRPKNGNVIKSNITYGTNGFWLDFRDATSTTTLGYDYSGNGNHWTLVNMSVAAGANNNSLEDSPTNNFCTFSPLLTDTRSDTSFRNGNLKVTTGSGASTVGTTSPQNTGKWYAEFVCTAKSSVNMMISVNSVEGFDGERQGNESQNGGKGYSYINNGNKGLPDGSNPSYGASWAIDDVMGIALDLDNNTVNFYKNNAAQGVINIDDGYNYVMTCGHGQSGVTATFDANFGQRPFTYTPPTGYRALSGHNRATPDAASVVKPQRFFDTLLWTGNNTVRTIRGLEFKPDFVWVKCRSNGHDHQITDSIRGVGKALRANENNSEDDWGSNGMGAFVDGGFVLTDTSNARYNENSQTFVAWCWKGGGAAVSNTNGNITSSVSVNEEAGFLIVLYTGKGRNGQNVGHGLRQAPQWIMLKSRTAGSNWRVWHHKLAADGSKRLLLDASNASEDASFLNDTAPSSTVFTLGNSDNAWNVSGGTYMAYCWHEVPGYSKFGSYTGNGSSNGTYVYLGFRPAFLMVKKTNTANSWVMYDVKRSTTNVIDNYLIAEGTDVDNTNSAASVDLLSNGFKFYSGYDIVNAGDYIYMAFAEQPSETIFGLDANAR